MGIAGYCFNRTVADRSRDTSSMLTLLSNAGSTCRSYVSHMASFPVPDEYKIVRHVQSVRTYVTELDQSNTPNVFKSKDRTQQWSCQERGNGEGQKGGLWMW